MKSEKETIYDYATEMLQSLKKVATRRISENDFNNLNNMGYKENL